MRVSSIHISAQPFLPCTAHFSSSDSIQNKEVIQTSSGIHGELPLAGLSDQVIGDKQVGWLNQPSSDLSEAKPSYAWLDAQSVAQDDHYTWLGLISGAQDETFREHLQCLRTGIDQKICEVHQSDIPLGIKKSLATFLENTKKELEGLPIKVMMMAHTILSELNQQKQGEEKINEHTYLSALKNKIKNPAYALMLTALNQIEKKVSQQAHLLVGQSLGPLHVNLRIPHADLVASVLAKVVDDIRAASQAAASVTVEIGHMDVQVGETKTDKNNKVDLFLDHQACIADTEKFTKTSTYLRALVPSVSARDQVLMEKTIQQIDVLTKRIVDARYLTELKLVENKKLSAQARSEVAQTVSYFVGYQQAREIKKKLKSIASHMGSNGMGQSSVVMEKLRHLALFFDAQSKRYLGESAAHNLVSHALFSSNHRFKLFDELALPGTSTSINKTIDLKSGVGSSVAIFPGMKVGGGVTLGVGRALNITTSFDGRESYSHKEELSASLNADIKAAFSYFSAGAGAALSHTFESKNYSANTLDGISKHIALEENSHRRLPDTMLLAPAVQNIFSSLVRSENALNNIVGLSKSDPNLRLYTTIKNLEMASGSEIVMAYALKQLGMDSVQQEPVFSLHELNPLTTGSSAASKVGIAKARTNPNEVKSVSVSAAAGTNTAFISNLLMSGNEKAAVMMPSIDANVSASGEWVKTVFHGTTLKPTHDLMSMAHTRSYAHSVSMANDIQKLVWQAKTQEGSALPKHLDGACQLMARIDAPLHAEEEVVQHIAFALNALRTLEKYFSQFEKAAPLLLMAAKNSADFSLSYDKNFYNEALTTILSHQLDGDKTLKKIDHLNETGGTTRPSQLANTHEAAREIVGRVWDSYSAALGMIELSGLGRISSLLKNLDQHAPIKNMLTEFVEVHTALAEKLANPNLGLSLDSLYRHAALESPDVSEKNVKATKREAALALSKANVSSILPTATLGLTSILSSSQALALGGSVATKTTRVSGANNPLGNGVSETVTYTGTLSGLMTALNGFSKNPKTINCLVPDNIFSEALLNACAAIYQDIDPTSLTLGGSARMATRALERDKSKQISVVATKYEATLQALVVNTTISKSIKSNVDFAKLSGATGVSAKLGAGKTESRTEVGLVMMGPELSYNISQLGELAAYGIDKDAAKKIKEQRMILTDQFLSGKDE